jgi:hypothetical protein
MIAMHAPPNAGHPRDVPITCLPLQEVNPEPEYRGDDPTERREGKEGKGAEVRNRAKLATGVSD